MRLSLLIYITTALASKSRFVPGPEDNTVDNQNGQLVVAPFAVDTSDLVIGGIFSLTNNGTRLPNDSGVQRAIAFECAIASVNDGSVGIQMPTKFYYNIQDDGFTVPWAVRAAVRLQSDGVPVVVGPSSSDQAVSAAPVYGASALPILSPAATSDALSDSVNYPSFFRLVPADVAQARAIAAACVYFNWSLITPIYTSDEYGTSGSLAFSAEANKNKISFTCGRTIRPGETNGIQNTNDCLASSDSNVVLLYMAAADASNVLATMYPVATNARLTFMASDAWADIQDFRLFSRDRFPPSFVEGTLGFAPELGNQQPYRQCASTYRPGDNDIPNFDRFWEITFRCSLNPDSKLPECPKGIYRDRDFIKIACKCNGDENLSQVPPDAKVAYVYDSVYAIANALNKIQTDCNSLEGVTFCDQKNITGTDLAAAIRVNQFDGLTGPVRFLGSNRLSLNFTILQYRSDGNRVRVGNVGIGNATFDNSLLIFKTSMNSTSKTQAINAQSQFDQPAVPGAPISEIVPQQITMGEPVGAIFTAFVFVGLVVCIVFHIYFFYYRKEKVVRKTSPIFNQLILIGVDMVFISQIFWVVGQTTLMCILKVWFICVGFGLIMGNLLAKTYRIYKIFNNVRVTSLVIKDTDLLKFSGMVILGEVMLLCIYCFIGGLTRPIVIQSNSDSLLKYIQCASPSSSIQLGLLIALFAYNILLVVAGVIIAYRTRNVDSTFNESKYIGFTMYVYLLASIILTPLYYTSGDSQSSISRQFILRTIGVVLSMYFTLFALFVPKIIAVERDIKARKSAKRREGTDTTATHRVTEISTTGNDETGGYIARGGRSSRSQTGGFSSTSKGGESTSEGSSMNRRSNSRSNTDY